MNYSSLSKLSALSSLLSLTFATVAWAGICGAPIGPVCPAAGGILCSKNSDCEVGTITPGYCNSSFTKDGCLETSKPYICITGGCGLFCSSSVPVPFTTIVPTSISRECD